MDLFFKGGRYLKEMLILNSFFFEDKELRFTRIKPVLALRLLSKGLFYIRAMNYPNNSPMQNIKSGSKQNSTFYHYIKTKNEK